MDVIKTDQLTKKFEKFIAVNHISLKIFEGEIFGFVGPDGAGKTTLLRLLTSIMTPSSGEAFVLGYHSVKEAELIKEKIGYLSQKCGLYPDLTVIENLEFYADIYCVPRQDRQKKMTELLAFSNLNDFKNRLSKNLSGGMKQKLGIACALIHQPKILFLDEPTYGVDPLSRRELWRILYKLLSDKVTIVISTSDMDEAERCGRVGLIYEGQLIAHGSPEEMKQLHKGTILEVRPGTLRQAIHLLRENFGNDNVRQFGHKIHIVTQQPDQTKKRIENLLKVNSIPIYSIKPTFPSLEDVFISFISHYEEKGKYE